jgi:integrase
MRYYDADGVAALIEAAEDEAMGALIHVAVATGCRLGELMALRWRDVDFDALTVRVARSLQWNADGQLYFKPPKSGRGRVISIAAPTAEVLRQHRVTQHESRLQAGSYDDLDLVFPRADGSPSPSRATTQRFKNVTTAAGFPDHTFHALRHTSATLALEAGVHPKVVQERLGHSSIAVTLDIYSHVVPAMETSAADSIAAALNAN